MLSIGKMKEDKNIYGTDGKGMEKYEIDKMCRYVLCLCCRDKFVFLVRILKLWAFRERL